MDTDLAQQAITCALAGEWKKALELNKQILKETKNDIDALNRMARAYFNLGEIRNAKNKFYREHQVKVLNTNELSQNKLIKIVDDWQNEVSKKQKEMLVRAVEKSKRSISSICREGILKQIVF